VALVDVDVDVVAGGCGVVVVVVDVGVVSREVGAGRRTEGRIG
jgi:hypothetical protein